ncbi:MAG: HlyD family efflux transporter periplasmic adaptor subunit [Lentimicrobiaceae bacterium]|nr:HlyD family efflux transporter periplasmic adaptor subunit [Lentimicrobiaceae bacterium]
MKTTPLVYIVIIALLLITSCNDKYDNDKASGAFEATEIVISAEANGKVTNLDVSEGELVAADQIIGNIDSTQLYLQKMLLYANNSAIIARKPDIKKQTATIEQQIATLNTEKQRTENLIEAKVVGQKKLDDINAQISLLNKQLTALTSDLASSSQTITAQSDAVDVQIAQINDQLDKCKIKSPIAGTIIEKYVETGEFTSIGMPLLKIANLDDMVLRAYISYQKLTQIKLNDKVKVRIDYGEEYKEYDGVITWISEEAEFTPKTIQTEDQRSNLVYAIKVSVKNDGYLKIGMYGEVIL